LQLADVDRDGVKDLLIEAQELSVLFGEPSSPTGFDVSNRVKVTGEGFAMTALNVDDDKPLELAVLTSEGVFVHDFDGRALPREGVRSMIHEAGIAAGSIVARDLDGDGLADLAYSDRELIHLRYLMAKIGEDAP